MYTAFTDREEEKEEKYGFHDGLHPSHPVHCPLSRCDSLPHLRVVSERGSACTCSFCPSDCRRNTRFPTCNIGSPHLRTWHHKCGPATQAVRNLASVTHNPLTGPRAGRCRRESRMQWVHECICGMRMCGFASRILRLARVVRADMGALS